MKKITMTAISLGAVGVLALAGCSNDKDSSSTSDTTPSPTGTATSQEGAPTPASIQGPEWCGDVYAVYTGTVETPVEAGNLIAAAAEKAGDQPTAQEALTGMADFLKAQNPESEEQISPEDMEKFNTLDATVNAQFAEFCGGKSIVDTIMEEYEGATGEEMPAPEGEVPVEPAPEGEAPAEQAE